MPSGTLEVTIVSARNLKLMDGGVSNDPYIQIRLGPQKFKTEVKLKAGREATWNQTFLSVRISVDKYLLYDRGLIEKFTELTLEVYDQDRMIDDTIGKTTIPLEGLLDQGVTDSWFTVGKGSNATGEVHARILFKPGNFPQGFDPQAVDWESHAKLGGGIAAGALALAAAGVGAKYAYDKYGKKEGEENEPLNEPHN
ncbi:hypothetical protein DSO57_1006901 [Entomophthora muscae]|uniref:Uncharacterized protein n=1 Tax=Entomophthora muscae TaxID=34485 RepID=A0ACC2U562_9FUNG|nr:hypothetical protein DSO57_1006901 [Entomophthora muscae]